ncbi:MAG: glycosyltransferase family 39 protein [Candidatus Levybacteria bacterium]|nr:glycosyltransferase family 39 protein [Candidatus Levybacteria bacterium]
MSGKIFISIILFLSFAFLIFFHTHGFIPYDEGWFLQAGLRLLDGEKIYKDFEFLYNPGGAYLNATAFALFGESVLASRLFALANSGLTVFILLFIARKLKLNVLITAILILIYIFWGPGHINFIWPVMLCLTTAIATGALFLLGQKNKNKIRIVFLIGVLSALTFIFKQNFGVAIFLVNLAIFLSIKDYRNFKLFLWYLIGYASIATAQILYFLNDQTLLIYVKEIYHFTIVKIYQQGILNSNLPWNYPDPVLSRILKSILYFSPFLISLFSVRQIFVSRKNRMLLYFPLASVSYYLFSTRPTTDYVHLAPLLALSGLPLVASYHANKKTWNKFIVGFILIFICIFGLYSALFRNYYRWNAPLIKQNIFPNNTRVRVWTDYKENENISEITSYFAKNAKDERYVFIYSFAPVYYLILDKKNPTRYDYLHTGVIDIKKQNEIVSVLQRKKLKHVLTNIGILKEPTIIATYIRGNYQLVKQINEYSVWEKN